MCSKKERRCSMTVCRRGSDVRGLIALGCEAPRWDPTHAPEAEWKDADIINLGHILNVIEDPSERIQTLHDVYSPTSPWLNTRVLSSSAQQGISLSPMTKGLSSAPAITMRDLIARSRARASPLSAMKGPCRCAR